VSFLIHYSEIALKKGNRSFFVNKLAENIKIALKDLDDVGVKKLSGRLLCDIRFPTFAAGNRISIVEERLKKIPGIANFMPAFEIVLSGAGAADMESLKQAVVKEIADRKFSSFRITAQRGDKDFPLTSEEINRELGAFVAREIGARVDLENPEFTVFAQILRDRIFFGFEKTKGVGGLPVGSSGRIVSLLSGGIDSPAASFMMMKRGCRAVFAHFHSFPYLDYSSQQKALELSEILNSYQYGSKLYLLPFGKAQSEIATKAPEPYRTVIYRRLMLRVSEKIAEKEKAGALATGESLGQVASQTMENISVIDKSVNLTVLRPLIGFNKEDIIKIAREIGTYDISIMPDQDCCQLFMPKHPVTKADIKITEKIEKDFDIPKMISGILGKAEIKIL